MKIVVNKIRTLFIYFYVTNKNSAIKRTPFKTKGNLVVYRPITRISLNYKKQPTPRLSSGEVTKEKISQCFEFFQFTLEKTNFLPKTKWQENDYFEVSAYLRLGPYHMENTGSRLITEVKPCRARSVLGWVTA